MQQTQNGDIARALTVAGSDSGGGAGIQADLKTFAAFGVFGSSAVTALTAQNTLGVQGVHLVPEEFVARQLDSVLTDIGAHAVKTGMLGNAAIISTVAEKLRGYTSAHIVVDPVMVAKGGASLLETPAVAALKAELLPLAGVITPNIPEAEALCGYSLHSLADCRQAARDLAQSGARIVVIKGGHADWAPDEVVDLVYDGRAFTTFHAPRVKSAKTHGTGCTFSSAIAACLALGLPPLAAIATAKAFVSDAVAMAASWQVGAGHGPLDHAVQPIFAQEIAAGQTYCRVHQQWQRVDTAVLE